MTSRGNGTSFLVQRASESYVDIACLSGEAARPGALATMQLLLEETMLIRVYSDVCDWVHPVFQQHVRPAMLSAKQPACVEKYATASSYAVITPELYSNPSICLSN